MLDTTPAPPDTAGLALTGLARFACALVILLIGALLVHAWRARTRPTLDDRGRLGALDREHVRVVHPGDVAVDAAGRRFLLEPGGDVVWLDDEPPGATARSCAHLSALDIADGQRCHVPGCIPVEC